MFKNENNKLADIKLNKKEPLIVSFTSCMGGVGKSTSAINFATYIAESFKLAGKNNKVLLVDGDLVNGNLILHLTNSIQPNWLDLINQMDNSSLNDYKKDIEPNMHKNKEFPNLDLLAASENPSFVYDINQNDLDNVIKAFKQHYSVIIFDTGTQITDIHNQAWLKHSNQIFFMINNDINSLFSINKYSKFIYKLKLVKNNQCNLIVNYYDYNNIDEKIIKENVDPKDIPIKNIFKFDSSKFNYQQAHKNQILYKASKSYNNYIKEIVLKAVKSYKRA